MRASGFYRCILNSFQKNPDCQSNFDRTFLALVFQIDFQYNISRKRKEVKANEDSKNIPTETSFGLRIPSDNGWNGGYVGVRRTRRKAQGVVTFTYIDISSSIVGKSLEPVHGDAQGIARKEARDGARRRRVPMAGNA